jgi:hypothetical protein
MKLTKGKLSKIYNKKKQTMRKFKIKSKISNKKGRGKTFRKKRPLNLNKKTLKNVEQIQMRNGRMMMGGEPTQEQLKAAKQKISYGEALLDEEIEKGSSSVQGEPLSVQGEPLSVQAEAVDDDKRSLSVEAEPFSSYEPQVQGSNQSSKPNFDAVAQGLKEYIDHTVAAALASSSSEDMQNPISSVSAAVETTEEGLRGLKSSPPENGELVPAYEMAVPSAPPGEY